MGLVFTKCFLWETTLIWRFYDTKVIVVKKKKNLPDDNTFKHTVAVLKGKAWAKIEFKLAL